MRKKTLFITQASVVAALYIVLTLLSALFGLDKGAVQFRISEVLTVLPFFIPSAIPGLFVGCLMANLLFGALPPDIIFGSAATLIGAVGTYYIGRKIKWLSALPPIAANTIIIPLVLKYSYHLDGAIAFFVLTVFAGELACCGILGTIFLYSLPPKLFGDL